MAAPENPGGDSTHGSGRFGWVWSCGATLEKSKRLTCRWGVLGPRVIVHAGSGWRDAPPANAGKRRAKVASNGRLGVRSTPLSVSLGSCVMERTSVLSILDKLPRKPSRKSLRRGRESRGAAGAGKNRIDDTRVVLKLRRRFRKSDNDLRCRTRGSAARAPVEAASLVRGATTLNR